MTLRTSLDGALHARATVSMPGSSRGGAALLRWRWPVVHPRGPQEPVLSSTSATTPQARERSVWRYSPSRSFACRRAIRASSARRRATRRGLVAAELVSLPGPEVHNVGVAVVPAGLSPSGAVTWCSSGSASGCCVAVLAHEAVDDPARGLAGEGARERGRCGARERRSVHGGDSPRGSAETPCRSGRRARPPPARRRHRPGGDPSAAISGTLARRRVAAAPAARRPTRCCLRTTPGVRPPRSPVRRARRPPHPRRGEPPRDS